MSAPSWAGLVVCIGKIIIVHRTIYIDESAVGVHRGNYCSAKFL